MRSGIALACAAVMAVAFVASAEETRQSTGRVNAQVVRLRAGPGTQYTIVGSVSQGDAVAVLGEKEGWYVIPFPADRPCWITKNMVSLKGVPGPAGAEGTLIGDKVNIRAAGDLRSQVMAIRNAGDKVVVVGEAGDWYKIRPPEEARAYVFRDYVTLDEPAPAEGVATPAAPAETPAAPAAQVPPASPATPAAQTPPAAQAAPPAAPAASPAAPADDWGIPGASVAGLSPKERLALAESLYRAEMKKGEGADLMTAGKLYARIANDYFSDEETRAAARERLRAVAVKLPARQRQELVTYEANVLREELGRIREHYRKESDLLSGVTPKPRFTAIGVVEEMARVPNRPGQYTLRVGRFPFYFLKSDTDLRKYLGRKVGIIGNVSPPPGGWSYQMLNIESIELLPELE